MKQLQKSVLGRTGLAVTRLGFGGWPIGGVMYGKLDRTDALQTVREYLDRGGNFLDTARWKGYGNSEALIGTVVGEMSLRDRVIIATKTVMGETLSTVEGIRSELEESLRQLKTNYVDLYYLHRPPEDPEAMAEALGVFESLKREGKIRAIGASIKDANVTDRTVELCRRYIESGRVDVIQIVYSILRQKHEQVFGLARERKVGIVARTVLESGFLSGKYRPGDVLAEGHRARWDTDTQRAMLKIAEQMRPWALRLPYDSLAQIAIQFALAPDAVASAIVGARTAEHVRRNVAAALLPPLPADLIEELKRRYGNATEQFNIR